MTRFIQTILKLQFLCAVFCGVLSGYAQGPDTMGMAKAKQHNLEREGVGGGGRRKSTVQGQWIMIKFLNATLIQV